ncbi:MAG: hypothetical protein NVSMB44_30420 [Ktedonobacteraceae bacterium]
MFGRGFGRRFYQGEGFPWEQGEGPGFGRGPWGRGPWGGPGSGRGPWGRGPWGGPGFGRGPWSEGQGPAEGRGPWQQWQRPEFSPEMQALRSTAIEVARLFGIAARNAFGNTEKQAQLRDFLESTRKQLLDIIGKSESTGQSEAQTEQV